MVFGKYFPLNLIIKDKKTKNMLESIGIIAIMAVAFYVYINYIDTKEREDKLKNKVLKNSGAAYDLVDKYNASIRSGKPIMTKAELDQRLKNISNSPSERRAVLQKEQESFQREQNRKEEMRVKRRYGYKYDVDIFEIFGANREMNEDNLTESIVKRFMLDPLESKVLLRTWEDNELIKRCQWNKSTFEIGSLLSYPVIDASDLVYSNWLKDNNIQLEERSKEYQEWSDSLPEYFY